MNISHEQNKEEPIDLKDPFLLRSAQLSKALGHPVRLAIISILSEQETCFCGDFTEVLPLAQSTVSQHLKVLKDAGLITCSSQGVRTCYCLNSEGIAELKTSQAELLKMLDSPIKALC